MGDEESTSLFSTRGSDRRTEGGESTIGARLVHDLARLQAWDEGTLALPAHKDLTPAPCHAGLIIVLRLVGGEAWRIRCSSRFFEVERI